MNLNYLDFEQPIAELEKKIEDLQQLGSDPTINVGDEIKRLEQKNRTLIQETFANLSAWQITQLARHPQRPYTQDYINRIFTDFEELHGDRCFADDAAIIGGIGRLEGKPVVIIGNQKGRTTKEKLHHRFGMSNPEGYRKSLRLMNLAERFRLPVLTFVDTPGAYPGIGAEERGQSASIADNLARISVLQTPIISTVIGEGGSGGALAIGIGDRLMMCQYSTYSVISPEGCASILWRSADKAAMAAEAMGVTATRAQQLGLIDRIISEPLGGAHRDQDKMAENLRQVLSEELKNLQSLSLDELVARRYRRLMSYGVFLDSG